MRGQGAVHFVKDAENTYLDLQTFPPKTKKSCVNYKKQILYGP